LAGADLTERACYLIPASPPQASGGRDDSLGQLTKQRDRDRNCACPHLLFPGCFTRPPGTSTRNHPHEPTTSKPVVPGG
jgi:hypothetical protein